MPNFYKNNTENLMETLFVKFGYVFFSNFSTKIFQEQGLKVAKDSKVFLINQSIFLKL